MSIFLLISLICFLLPKIQNIVNLVAQFFYQNEAQTEITKLKKELATISISSEYTKYVKTERKLVALQSSQSNQSIIPKSYIIKQALVFILNVSLAIISITHRYEVAIFFGKRFNFSSLEKIISFPAGCTNSLSIFLWIIINNYAAKTIYNVF